MGFQSTFDNRFKHKSIERMHNAVLKATSDEVHEVDLQGDDCHCLHVHKHVHVHALLCAVHIEALQLPPSPPPPPPDTPLPPLPPLLPPPPPHPPPPPSHVHVHVHVHAAMHNCMLYISDHSNRLEPCPGSGVLFLPEAAGRCSGTSAGSKNPGENKLGSQTFVLSWKTGLWPLELWTAHATA
jgi:hypothetical protein